MHDPDPRSNQDPAVDAADSNNGSAAECQDRPVALGYGGVSWPGPIAYRHRPPALLVHGFTHTGWSWHEIAPLLDRPILAPTLPGHGGAPLRTGSATLDSLADSLAATLAMTLRTGHIFHLVGYSLGGRVALHGVSTGRLRPASLTLISTSPGFTDRDSAASRRLLDAQLAARITTEGVAAFATSWAASPLFATLRQSRPDLGEKLAAMRVTHNARDLARVLSQASQGRQRDLRPALGEAGFPVLLIAGGADRKYARSAIEMQAFPGCRAVVIEGRGHAVHLEAPDIVASLMRDFMNESDGFR